MKRRLLLALLALAVLGGRPAQVHAAPHVSCKYVVQLHRLLLDLNTFLKKESSYSKQMAHDKGLALLIREGYFNTKAHPLPLDLNRNFGSAIMAVEYAAGSRVPKGNSTYARFSADARHSATVAWAAYRKAYSPLHCKGA